MIILALIVIINEYINCNFALLFPNYQIRRQICIRILEIHGQL